MKSFILIVVLALCATTAKAMEGTVAYDVAVSSRINVSQSISSSTAVNITPALILDPVSGRNLTWYSYTFQNISTTNYFAYAFGSSNTVAPTIACDGTNIIIPTASAVGAPAYLTEQSQIGYLWVKACVSTSVLTSIVRGR